MPRELLGNLPLKGVVVSAGFGIWLANFREIFTDEKANAEFSEYIAERIRRRVKDPKLAEKLIPRDHGFGVQRVPMETNYFEAFNRPDIDRSSRCATPRSTGRRRSTSWGAAPTTATTAYKRRSPTWISFDSAIRTETRSAFKSARTSPRRRASAGARPSNGSSRSSMRRPAISAQQVVFKLQCS